MPSPEQSVRIYRELAECHERQGEAQLRDRFLVLAADAARAAGRDDEAERLRATLLRHNPHHLLKPFGSFAEGLKSPDVQNYVAALRRSHPPEAAEQQLATLRPGAGPAASDAAGEAAPAVPEVYRIRDEAAEHRADAHDVTRTRVSPRIPAMRPAPARPAPLPEIYSFHPEPVAPGAASAPAEGESRESPPGAWVSTLLFLVLLGGGIALAVYTLGRPFLPMGRVGG